MAVLQTGVLRLGPCIIFILLTCGDFSSSNNNKMLHWINETAAKGETVVLHCNGSEDSGEDIIWRKEKNLLFNYSPYINQTTTNYTSNRMSVDPKHPPKLQISNVQPSDAGTYVCFPSRIQWILTIQDTKRISDTKAEWHRSVLLYIITSVTAAIAVFFIIFCTVWIHKKKKTRSSKNEVELQPQERGNVQNRQYFERFNSIYGQIFV